MDAKVIFLLLPFWLGAVIAVLWMGFVRPKIYRFVSVLIDKACFSPETALTAEEAGLTHSDERRFLQMRGAFGGTVKAVDGKYYVPEEQSEKACALYGRRPVPLWLAFVWVLALAVFFVALAWVIGSFVDTSVLSVPWYN